jgi:hypothetical protein
VSAPVAQKLPSEFASAVATVEAKGYDVLYVPGPTTGAGKYRVTNPRRAFAPSFFTREELITLAACQTRGTFLAALDAARVVNKFVTREEIEMTDKSKKSGKPVGAPIDKPSATKRGSKKSAAAADSGASKSSSKKAARAMKAPKEPKQPREAGGASVKGSSPELLAYLAKFQEQTIERMNGARVVEVVVSVMNATVDEPISRKGLGGIYPQRIAGEMAKLGIFRKEHVDGVGLCYFAANGLKKLANKQQAAQQPQEQEQPQS